MFIALESLSNGAPEERDLPLMNRFKYMSLPRERR